MTGRRIDGFFYGLFMDDQVLRDQGVRPVNPRRAFIENFALRIGQRATLVPEKEARVYGMLFAMNHEELGHLYKAPGLDQYCPEAVLTRTMRGEVVPALCFNLPEAPAADEANPDYAASLRAVLERLAFPADYIRAVK